MHCFSYTVIATETEADIAYTPAGFRIGAFLLDASHCVDEVDCIVVMFFNASSYRQNVWIENDVLGWEFTSLTSKS